MPIAEALTLRNCAVRARIFSIALDLQTTLVGEPDYSPSGERMLGHAVAVLRRQVMFITRHLASAFRLCYVDQRRSMQ